jgi:hypothetical protein
VIALDLLFLDRKDQPDRATTRDGGPDPIEGSLAGPGAPLAKPSAVSRVIYTLKVSETAPASPLVTKPVKGKGMVTVSEGIDPGFAYHPGKVGLRTRG